MVEGVNNPGGPASARITQAPGNPPQIRVGQGRKIDSNEIPKESPGAALKIVLYRLGYDVYGVTETRDSNGDVTINVEDARLYPDEIQSIIERFSESRYNIEFPPDVEGFGKLLAPALNEIKADFPEWGEVIDRCVTELTREGIPGKNEGLTDEDRSGVFKLLDEAYKRFKNDPSDKNEMTVYVLERICAGLKKTPGLSFSDQTKLKDLMGIMLSTGPILIGKRKEHLKGLNADQQKVLNEGYDVLVRMGCDVSAIADYGRKKDASILGLLKDWGRDLSVTSKGERRATSMVPEGSIPVLKYILFPDRIARLELLGVKLFGENGNGGLIGNSKDYKELTESREWIDTNNELILLYQKSKANHGLPPEEYNKALKLEQRRNELIKSHPGAVSFEMNGNNELFMALEEYYRTLEYISSDEIDGDFLARLEMRFPRLMRNEFADINNPYRSLMERHSAYDLIFKKGGWDSIAERFKRGERWTTLNVVAGEGALEENILLAKQALSRVISSINLTSENVDISGPGLFILAPRLLPGIGGVASQIASILMQKRLRVTTGARSEESLSDNGLFTRALNNIGLTTGTQANFNYGLAWKMMLIQQSEKPHMFLSESFGKDAVRNRNLLGEPGLKDIIRYVEDFYRTLASKPEAWQQLDFDKLNFRDFTSDSEALEQLKKLMALLKSKSGYFNLQEEHMPVELFQKAEDGTLVATVASEADMAEIRKGAKVLRDLLMDVNAIYSALVKAGMQEGGKTKITRDPVMEAVFGVKGERINIVVQGETGELEDAKYRSESSGIIGGAAEVGKLALETQLMYTYEMPLYAIPGGFLQTGLFAYEAARYGYRNLLNERYLAHINSILGSDYRLEASEADIKRAELAWQSAKELATQTYVTFFGFEYLPYYPLKQAYERMKHGDIKGGAAEGAVSAVFFRYALQRSMTTAGTVLKLMSGELPATAESFNVLLANQGMTMRYPLLAGRWLYNTNIPGLRFFSRAMMDSAGFTATNTYRLASETLDLMPSVRYSAWRAGDWFDNFMEESIRPRIESIRYRGQSAPAAVRKAGEMFRENILSSRGFERVMDYGKDKVGRAVMGARKVVAGKLTEYGSEFEIAMREGMLKRNLQSVLADAIRREIHGTSFGDAMSAARARGVLNVERFELEFAEKMSKECNIDSLADDLAKSFMEGKRNFRATPRMLNLLDDVALKMRALQRVGLAEAQLNAAARNMIMESFGSSREWQELFQQMARSKAEEILGSAKGVLSNTAEVEKMVARFAEAARSVEGLYGNLMALKPGQALRIGNMSVDAEVLQQLIASASKGQPFADFLKESASLGSQIGKAESQALTQLDDIHYFLSQMKASKLRRLGKVLEMNLKAVSKLAGKAGTAVTAAAERAPVPGRMQPAYAADGATETLERPKKAAPKPAQAPAKPAAEAPKVPEAVKPTGRWGRFLANNPRFSKLWKGAGRVIGAAGVGMAAADVTDLTMDIAGVKEGSTARKVVGVGSFVGGTAAALTSETVAKVAGTPAVMLYGVGMGASAAAWGLKKAYGIGDYQSSLITRASERFMQQKRDLTSPIWLGKKITDKLGMKTYSDVWFAATYAESQYDQIEAEDKERVQAFVGVIKSELKSVMSAFAGKKVSRMSPVEISRVKMAIKTAIVRAITNMGIDTFGKELDFARFYRSGDNSVDLPAELLDQDFNKIDSLQPSERFITWAMHTK